MVDKIEVKATYKNPNHVPRIGQRKAMRVNGRVQTVTLNAITVERMHDYREPDMGHSWYFKATETWGGFYDVSGM